MNNITKTKKNSGDKVIGEDVLLLNNGSIIRVHSAEHPLDLDQILMKVNNKEKSLFNLETGNFWGNNLEGYVFEVLNSIQINKVDE